MGARMNYAFKTNEDQPFITLYSHWGETTWRNDLAQALVAARSRWSDETYCLRIIIDQLTKDSRDVDTGYGISLATRADLDFLDYPVIIDLIKQVIIDESGEHSWDAFIAYNTVPA